MKHSVRFLALALAWSLAPAAYAIKATKAPDAGTPWLLWVITIALAGVCALVAFKNAKRSHQD